MDLGLLGSSYCHAMPMLVYLGPGCVVEVNNCLSWPCCSCALAGPMYIGAGQITGHHQYVLHVLWAESFLHVSHHAWHILLLGICFLQPVLKLCIISR